MKIKDLTRTQQFVLLLVALIGIIVLAWIIWLGRSEWIMTFHLTTDNNTLELFKTINYTMIN